MKKIHLLSKTQLIRHIFTIRIIYFKNYSNIQYEILSIQLIDTHNFYTGFTFFMYLLLNQISSKNMGTKLLVAHVQTSEHSEPLLTEDQS